ncbi:AraC family transcriptional regulator [Blautia schinkii]|nr:AraC family transcriptional regulator [Blautia schinkii]
MIRGIVDERKTAVQEGAAPYYLFAAAVWGTMGRSGSYEFHPASDIIREIDFGFVKELEKSLGKEIYHFPGHYANDHLFVIPSETPHLRRISEAAEYIGHSLCSAHSFVTVCYTGKGKPPSVLREKLRELYCELPARIVFGENKILCFPGKGFEKTKPSCTVKQVVDEIHMSMDKAQLKRILDDCCQYWKQTGMTQVALQEELRFLFENPKIHHRIEPMEFLYQAYSYEDLAEQLFLELCTVLCLNEPKASERSSMLVERVREYLDIHFAEEISYKEFNRIFGYNEKYITAVFKEKLGVTPSRYVLEKKMELARRLLSSDCGMLLKEVAQRVGYSDQLYFSKVFKNCTGMSPSSYMKREKCERGENV